MGRGEAPPAPVSEAPPVVEEHVTAPARPGWRPVVPRRVRRSGRRAKPSESAAPPMPTPAPAPPPHASMSQFPPYPPTSFPPSQRDTSSWGRWIRE